MAEKKTKDAMIPMEFNSEDLILSLFSKVAKRELTPQEAGQRIRDYLSKQSEENQELFKQKAREYGRLLLSCSEAFLQELTVIGAGQ